MFKEHILPWLLILAGATVNALLIIGLFNIGSEILAQRIAAAVAAGG